MLGLGAADFEDAQTLALALERRIDARNGRLIVGLLSQLAGDGFPLGEVRRAFRRASFEGLAPRIRPWSNPEPGARDPVTGFLADYAFFARTAGCDRELGQLTSWLAALPADLRAALRDLLEAGAHRFFLAVDLLASCGAHLAVRLGVQHAAIEISYFMPELFVLDRAHARETGADLLRHLRIGTLYHELLVAARADPRVDVGAVLALLSGESEPAAIAYPQALA